MTRKHVKMNNLCKFSNLLVKFSTSQNQKFSLSLDIQANIYRRERCLEDVWGICHASSPGVWMAKVLSHFTEQREYDLQTYMCFLEWSTNVWHKQNPHQRLEKYTQLFGIPEFFRSCLWLSSVSARRQKKKVHLLGGFQPIWKNISQIGNLPQIISK